MMSRGHMAELGCRPSTALWATCTWVAGPAAFVPLTTVVHPSPALRTACHHTFPPSTPGLAPGLPSPLQNKHRQVGNAVPPPLAAALGRELRKALEKTAEERRKQALAA